MQWDTSDHDWLSRGERLYLIAMIDDATSRLFARFVRHDSTEENLKLLWSYMEKFGRPVSFYTDKASLFQTAEKHQRDEPGVEKDPVEMPELRGRAGKQPDGGAKTREVKLCTVWSAETRDEEDRPVLDEGSVTYTAAIESAATLDTDDVPAAFTLRVQGEADRRRCTAVQRTVVLGDGAPWIW